MNRRDLPIHARWRSAFVLALFASVSATAVHAADAIPADADNSTVGEIIVTATKRSENLQDVPISIQALTPLLLDQHQVESFDDYAKLLPSVSFQSFGPGQSQLFFRGISSGGDGLHGGSQPATSTYIDETPLTTIANGVDLHIYDVQRVEALSGPQGTLYGASSLSGTLRVITNQPNPAGFSAGFDAEANKFSAGTGGGTLEGYVNIPLGPKAAIRLVAFDEEDGGYIDNVPNTRIFDVNDGTGNILQVPFSNTALVRKDFNTVDTHGGRAALKLELTDNWTITPMVIVQDQKAKGDFLYDPRLGHLRVSDFQPSLNVDKWYDAALTIQGKIADWDVLYSGSYFSRKVDNHADYSYYSVYYNSVGATSVVSFPDGHGGFLDPDQIFIGHDDYLKNSHELRISSPVDKRFRIMGGVFTQWQSDNVFANYVVPGALGSGTGVTVPGFGDDLFYTHILRVDRDSAIFTISTSTSCRT
jgi:iron complex outermembrane receptor protein